MGFKPATTGYQEGTTEAPQQAGLQILGKAEPNLCYEAIDPPSNYTVVFLAGLLRGLT